MRVLFISPLPVYQEVTGPIWLPLGLAYIAAYLRERGHDAAIFDRYAARVRLGPDRERIDRAMLERIERFQPDLIGLQTVSPLIYDTVECAAKIRKTFSGMMVAGGHHATALPETCFEKIPGLDGVVAGEGEAALARLAGGEGPASIPGLWWRGKGGKVSGSPPEQIDDLDRLPLPALDLMDMAFYTRRGLNTIRGHYLSTVSMITSRGCVRGCEFCAESLTYGKGVRFNSVDYVMEWIDQMLRDFRVEGVYFHDNDFLIDRARVEEFSGAMIARGHHKRLRWAIQARADNIEGQLVRLLKRAGCVLVEIGVESSVASHLEGIGKRASVETMTRAVRLCRREGLGVHAYMMTGFEGETLQDLEENLGWLKTARPDSFTWAPLSIYPGTALYRRRGNNFFEEHEWTEPVVQGYYGDTDLSAVPGEERKRWLEERLLPHQRRRGRVNVLKSNLPFRLLRYIYTHKRRYLKRLDEFLRERIRNADRALLKRAGPQNP